MPFGTRKPAVAGRFYPADPGRLTAFMQEHLLASRQPQDPPARAIIVPHAGYPYSGNVAAQAFAKVDFSAIRRVIVIGPTHHVEFRGISTSPQTAFETPLGDVELDRPACDDLGKGDYRYTHRMDVHRDEHAIEVELPFIKYLAPDAQIIPLICGQMTVQDIHDVAERLKPYWDDTTLLVISSDFTHYGYGYMPFSMDDAPDRLPELDGGAIEAIKQLDHEAFMRYVEETGATICGRFPIAIMLRLIEQNDGTGKATLLDYTNSGQITGDYSYSVSYAGITYQA